MPMNLETGKRFAGILATLILGVTFFFAIIGVFGLWLALGALLVAILISCTISLRSPGGEGLL